VHREQKILKYFMGGPVWGSFVAKFVKIFFRFGLTKNY
jgi:hypothetical protein